MKLKALLVVFFCSLASLSSAQKEPISKKGLSSLSDHDSPSVFDWGVAQWIGSSADDRPEEWSARALVRNQPPHDINTWEPTAKELKAVYRKAHPSVLLRRSITLTKKIVSAQAAVCGVGLYELYLNGDKVGDRVLDPAQTSYDKRAFYVLHDLTRLLQDDKNTLGLMLGNGFYGQNQAFWAGLNYGPPRVLFTLMINYEDGTSERIISDQTWKAHTSPILYDNIYLGETYDARKEIVDWCQPTFDASHWANAEVNEAPTTNLIEQDLEPMRKVREVLPLAILPAEKGWIIDMGQNMTGHLHIAVEEAAGTVVAMRFAEHLMPNKLNIDPASTGIHVTGSVQTDYYICKGEGREEWEPRFTYHGFRYVQIEGLSGKPSINDFKGWLVRTDVARIGHFECSDALINKFYDVSMWTIEDNMQGVLSDCPHRERCAWMGDAYVVAEAASYNFDMLKFWRKTSADMETVLGVSKAHIKDDLPYDPRTPSNISVGKRLCFQARPDWGAATVMVPWYAYLYYGDSVIVDTAWPMMVGWMGYLDERVQQGGIIKEGYGDWCPPGGNPAMETSPSLTSTALYYQSLLAMHQMGLMLGEDSAATVYLNKSKTVKQAFNNTFFNDTLNTYGSQTGNAFALFSLLAPQGKEQAVADNLAKNVMVDHEGHYSTGIFGHRALYTILNDYGHSDVLTHLWKITDYPSLGYMTEKHNLTTWPEVPQDWDINKRYHRNSFNHPMNSGFAASFHESIGGIRPDPAHPGFANIILNPTFVPSLEWAKVSYECPQGVIKSEWRRESGRVVWDLLIPQGSTASVELKGYDKKKITLDGTPVADHVFELSSGHFVINVLE